MFLSLAQDELSALRLLSDFAAALGWGSGICGRALHAYEIAFWDTLADSLD
jgi:hypothetical protein